MHINTPVLTANDCEGAGEMFKVNNSTASSKGTATCICSDIFKCDSLEVDSVSGLSRFASQGNMNGRVAFINYS